jgi:2-iminobutanoate/2-iminopropanoate deaminase
MKLEPIISKNTPIARYYSPAMRVNGFVFVSGQTARNPETGQVVDDFPGQVRQALENMKQILVAAGSGLDKVVAVDIFFTDMSLFEIFNQVYETFFPVHKPARTTVGVSSLGKGFMIEVKCIAVA